MASGIFLLLLLPTLSPGEDDARPAVPARVAPLSYLEQLPGTSITFHMIGIPGGTFVRGSLPTESGRRDDEGPRHPVAVAPFWMGQCEVTWDEFDVFRKLPSPARIRPRTLAEILSDAVTRPTEPYIDETQGFGRTRFPVIGVSHHAASEYCRWLSARTGRRYRLPTEAEWEYACRAGTQTPWVCGPTAQRLGDYAWYAANSNDMTHPVKGKRANPWGLHDIVGNAAEWCLDSYDAKAYQASVPDKILRGPVKVPGLQRYGHGVRGGSWASKPEDCRSAARHFSTMAWMKSDPLIPKSIWWLSDNDTVGFRIVRPVSEQEELQGWQSPLARETP